MKHRQIINVEKFLKIKEKILKMPDLRLINYTHLANEFKIHRETARKYARIILKEAGLLNDEIK